jgi:hypothetical protein
MKIKAVAATFGHARMVFLPQVRALDHPLSSSSGYDESSPNPLRLVETGFRVPTRPSDGGGGSWTRMNP